MIHPSVARPDPLQRAVRGALLGLALSAAAAPLLGGRTCGHPAGATLEHSRRAPGRST